MKSFSFTTAALLGATAGLALFAGPALAQPQAAATYDWSGPYVGANVGWNNTLSHADAGTATTQQLTGVSAGAGPVAVPPATFNTATMDYSGDGFAAGGQVGFNHQLGHVVLGFEGDMDAVGGRAAQGSLYSLPATALTTGSKVFILHAAHRSGLDRHRARPGGLGDGPSAALRHRRPRARRRTAGRDLRLRSDRHLGGGGGQSRHDVRHHDQQATAAAAPWWAGRSAAG